MGCATHMNVHSGFFDEFAISNNIFHFLCNVLPHMTQFMIFHYTSLHLALA